MAINEPTIATILRTLADQYSGPVAERQICERVLQQRPSSAKNPFATIRDRLRWDGLSLGWVRLERGELIPLHVVLQGLRFRCLPSTAEVSGGYVYLNHFFPFVHLQTESFQFEDEHGTPLAVQYHALSTDYHQMLDLGAWYRQTGFTSRDSLLCTVVQAKPLTIRLVHEPFHAFAHERVATQDTELLDAVLLEMNAAPRPLIPCDELILAIFARAPWRTSYPGMPWQYLIAHHPKLQLIDSVFLTINSADGLGMSPDQRHQEEETLRTEINQLQRDIMQSRERDQTQGIWDGQIVRASLGNEQYQDTSLWEDDLLSLSDDSVLDDLFQEPWDDSWEEDLDYDPLVDPPPTDATFYDLSEATQQLLAALPNEAAERLQHARPEEVELIIAEHLNHLLVHAPALFVPLTPSLNSFTYDSMKSPDGESIHDLLLYAPGDGSDEWEAWGDDEEDQSRNIYSRSSELMALFYVYLVDAGRSITTARARAHSLWIYADFLASYYQRSLADGDYATLDECLFFFYPRKLMSRSARQVRELSTSIKQFYAFLKQSGDIADDRFAEAIWRRREQAARVVQIFQRLERSLPNFDNLYAQLFTPYVIVPGSGRS